MSRTNANTSEKSESIWADSIKKIVNARSYKAKGGLLG